VDPGPFFYIYITIYCKQCLLSASIIYFTANKHLFPHYTSNPLFIANRWDWQTHRKLGQSSLVVLCAGSMLLLVPTPRTRLFSGAIKCSLASLPKSARNNHQKWFLSPTRWLNLCIITKGKLTAVLIIPSSWGFPTGPMRHQDFFWCCCRWERGVLHGESLTSNIFYFVIVLLSFFTLFCLLLVYQKYKKQLVPFIVVIFIYFF
jgi:hypothetical protein